MTGEKPVGAIAAAKRTHHKTNHSNEGPYIDAVIGER